MVLPLPICPLPTAFLPRLQRLDNSAQGGDDLIALDGVLAELQDQFEVLGGRDEAKDGGAGLPLGVTFGAGLFAVHHTQREALGQVFHLGFVRLAGHLEQL